MEMKTVLVVDDFSMNLKIAEFALKGKYNILTAESGQDALDILSTNDINIVLLDINMPGMDGFETYDKLRQMDKYKNTPVAFMTADTDNDCLSRIEALNVPVIEKPFNPTMLGNTIEGLL